MDTFIVDDEPPARTIIKEYLEDFPQLTVVGEFENGREAVEAINRDRPELVFLDIQMPGLDGFEVLEQLEHWPPIIFSTAYDRYAVRAFEVNAVDYLLKPYDRNRFEEAVRRVLDEDPDGPDLEDLAGLLRDRPSESALQNRLFVRVGRKIVPVNLDEVLWIEAEGDYSILHTEDEEYTCSTGIGALEGKLDGSRFVRVHRSSMVAVEAIDHLTSDGSGGYIARLSDGTRVRVSRSYAEKIRELIS